MVDACDANGRMATLVTCCSQCIGIHVLQSSLFTGRAKGWRWTLAWSCCCRRNTRACLQSSLGWGCAREAPRLAQYEQTCSLAALEAIVGGLRIILGACCTHSDRVTEAFVGLVVVDACQTDCRMAMLNRPNVLLSILALRNSEQERSPDLASEL